MFGLTTFAQAPFNALGGVSQPLTGVNAAGNVGTLTNSRTAALTGVGASGAVGTMIESDQDPVLSVNGQGNVGTVS